MKKVLLTGATGFIGRHTIPYLLSEGYEIHAITRNDQFLSPLVQNHQADLFNDSDIKQLIRTIQPSHLLHLAWYAKHGKFWSSEINLECVKSSIQLIQEFAVNGGKRIVIAGSCAEYEWGPNPCDELCTPIKPHSLYGSSKAALYQLIKAYALQKNLSFAWGRIFFLYGPFEYKERLVPSVIQKLLDQTIASCSHGNQIRDFMHVEDVANAFVTLLSSDIQDAINIASGQNVSIKDLINRIGIKLSSLEKVQYGSVAAPNDPPIITANVNRLTHELKWSPKYCLDIGLNQTIAWWKNQYKENCKPR